MPFTTILMSYKDNCKIEGEMLTKLKIARLHFASGLKQKIIAKKFGCHQNTVNNIIRLCKYYTPEEGWLYLKTSRKIPTGKLDLFKFLKHNSRRPKTNKRALEAEEEKFVIDKHSKLNYGSRRLFKHLRRKGYNVGIYTFGKIKGVYKRNSLSVKKIRTANGERRPLYDYSRIAAFEFLQYDTKVIPDKHSLPTEIYNKFKYGKILPIYQWTIVDAKTKTRFLAWSYELSSFFGFAFLLLVILWLRAHNIYHDINAQIDGGIEFCSASKKKLKEWNDFFQKFNVKMTDTGGCKWKQNLVERTHRIDDEDFYCPRGDFIDSKENFLKEAQDWIIYYNNRSSEGIGMNDLSPKEKLYGLGIYNAEAITNFPCIILEDFFEELSDFTNLKSQNVLIPYPNFPKGIP